MIRRRKNFDIALSALAAVSAAAAVNFNSYSNVVRNSEIDSGEGITRQGVNKCVKKRRRKRRGNKSK